MPKVSPEMRAAALGVSAPRAAVVPELVLASLRQVSTATLTTQLQRRGIRNPFIAGLRPTRPDLRMAGIAHTVRYVPVREDVVKADTRELNAQKTAIETVSAGRGARHRRSERGGRRARSETSWRCARSAAARAGIVTDGGLRDSPAVGTLDIPTYYRAPHASVLGLLHYPLETNVPIACGGVLVLPGDVIVGDAEGVSWYLRNSPRRSRCDAVEQELVEQFAFERVNAGESIRGVFPLADDRRAEYEAWRRARREDAPVVYEPAERE